MGFPLCLSYLAPFTRATHRAAPRGRGGCRPPRGIRGRSNHLAGFTHEDDRLPAFFYEEPVPPKGYTARFRPEDLGPLYERLHQEP